MGTCPYRDPDILSKYYEGVLEKDLERAFERHLLTCTGCMEALTNLERDLSLMREAQLVPVKASAPKKGLPALFRITAQGLELLLDPKPWGFKQLLPQTVRGHRQIELLLERDGIRMWLLPEPGSARHFRIRLQGIGGKRGELRCCDRLVERWTGGQDEIEIEWLEPGFYIVYIGGKVFDIFIVQEEGEDDGAGVCAPKR